ncbi:MAG: methylenetetrahydrofolate--tRNA-(uracil(54)-C(5))-methyltransferase (FADH(2)-oxidizing) TrmFO [Alphaproteobacteria bacterium]|nr:methylenetetrahydrofolate--tRNA-(uracil(54)-C(5))-methyltransferase (FADH(2)-oxidizing) TrmFO [Alphaproteobacteria bacterium]
MTQRPVTVVGAGLAGCEAAWQIAKAGIPVVLKEMRPKKMTPAHKTDGFAELVCSNSLRSDDTVHNAVGLLHEEMRRCGSLIMEAAKDSAVPAGGALAVDRAAFSKFIEEKLRANPLVTLIREELTELPDEKDGPYIIATGPLTSPELADKIQALAGGEELLHFFDAIAPIVSADSVDMTKAWKQSRYDRGDGDDYINCPMSKEEYDAFIDALLGGEKIAFKEWEKNTPYFEGCLPIEVMAERGRETLAFGPMKPVGLTDPRTGTRPYAVVQLRKENRQGTLLNLVGFQTKLTYGEQKRIFKMIPGLENAEFVRLGGIHRNTFICSPKVLDETLRLKARTNIRFAGQVTGCEGYVESASVGLMAGLFAAKEALGQAIVLPPETTALGAMLRHITVNANEECFQPMNINFGLFPPPPLPEGKRKLKGLDRKRAQSERALHDLDLWIREAKLNG